MGWGCCGRGLPSLLSEGRMSTAATQQPPAADSRTGVTCIWKGATREIRWLWRAPAYGHSQGHCRCYQEVSQHPEKQLPSAPILLPLQATLPHPSPNGGSRQTTLQQHNPQGRGIGMQVPRCTAQAIAVTCDPWNNGNRLLQAEAQSASSTPQGEGPGDAGRGEGERSLSKGRKIRSETARGNFTADPPSSRDCI